MTPTARCAGTSPRKNEGRKRRSSPIAGAHDLHQVVGHGEGGQHAGLGIVGHGAAEPLERDRSRGSGLRWGHQASLSSLHGLTDTPRYSKTATLDYMTMNDEVTGTLAVTVTVYGGTLGR